MEDTDCWFIVNHRVSKLSWLLLHSVLRVGHGSLVTRDSHCRGFRENCIGCVAGNQRIIVSLESGQYEHFLFLLQDESVSWTLQVEVIIHLSSIVWRSSSRRMQWHFNMSSGMCPIRLWLNIPRPCWVLYCLTPQNVATSIALREDTVSLVIVSLHSGTHSIGNLTLRDFVPFSMHPNYRKGSKHQ